MWSQAQLLGTPGPDSQMPHLTPGRERGRLLPTPSPRPHVGIMVLLPQSRLGQGPTVMSRGPRSTCDSHQDAISSACPARCHRHSTRLRAGGEAAHMCGPGGRPPAQARRRRHPRISRQMNTPVPPPAPPQFPLYWFSVPAVLKGWMDRVLCQGFAFDFPGSYDDGLLKVRPLPPG